MKIHQLIPPDLLLLIIFFVEEDFGFLHVNFSCSRLSCGDISAGKRKKQKKEIRNVSLHQREEEEEDATLSSAAQREACDWFQL